jgi:hypothetical protein
MKTRQDVTVGCLKHNRTRFEQVAYKVKQAYPKVLPDADDADAVLSLRSTLTSVASTSCTYLTLRCASHSSISASSHPTRAHVDTLHF